MYLVRGKSCHRKSLPLLQIQNRLKICQIGSLEIRQMTRLEIRQMASPEI